MAEVLRVEKPSPGVVLLTLSVPERRNAMTEELTTAWNTQLALLAADAELRCLVVTGAGSAFCSGGDLSWIEEGATTMDTASVRRRMQYFYRSWLSVRDLEVPVLAAVNGPAIGAGLCLALACDMRYAASTASFSVPFTRLGMHPGMAATYLLTEAVGVVRARELFYTGRRVGAEEAVALNLVNGVFEPDALLPEVLAIADGIAATAPIATRLTKVGLTRGTARTFQEALDWEALAQPVTMTTEDFAEGFVAVRERRTPVFRHR